jgi:hypothetical protein
MRTTIDLPPELMHAAKVKAAQRGESLKKLSPVRSRMR